MVYVNNDTISKISKYLERIETNNLTLKKELQNFDKFKKYYSEKEKIKMNNDDFFAEVERHSIENKLDYGQSLKMLTRKYGKQREVFGQDAVKEDETIGDKLAEAAQDYADKNGVSLDQATKIIAKQMGIDLNDI